MRKLFAVFVLFATGILVALFVRISPHLSSQVVHDDYKCRDCNVILISIDTLRADHLGTYGHYRNISPTIDRFAAEAVLFEHAFSQAPSTVPSHMSIMTSRYPSEHGVCAMDSSVNCLPSLDEGFITLAEVLRAHEYYTVGFTGGAGVHADLGFKRGFYEYNHLSMEGFLDQENPFNELLDDAGNRQFFLFLHTYKTHDPYFPMSDSFGIGCDNLESLMPLPFEELRQQVVLFLETDPSSHYSKEIFNWMSNLVEDAPYFDPYPYFDQEFRDILGKGFSAEQASELLQFLLREKQEEINRILAFQYLLDSLPEHKSIMECMYNAEIYEMDNMISRLFSALRQSALQENTIIIFTSDHGEEFLEHGGFGHGHTLYNELLHVPLIILNPRFEKGGMRITNPVRCIDIFPTTLDMLGISQGFTLQGTSLTPLMRNRDVDVLPIYSECCEEGMYSIIDKVNDRHYKLIEYPDAGEEEIAQVAFTDTSYHQLLFNLDEDPREQNNLIEVEQATAALLAQRLENFKSENAGTLQAGGRCSEGETDEEILAQLRSMGYLT